MDHGQRYSAFFHRYGGSARTKNLSRRAYPLPSESALPKEFIRLCPWEIEYLYAASRLAREGILEIGRYHGGSTFLFAHARTVPPIYSIDRAPQGDDRLRLLFAQESIGQNVELIVADSRVVHPAVGAFDFLFIDGDHSYEGCRADIDAWYPKLAVGGHMIVHDSHLDIHGVQAAIMDFLAEEPGLQVLLSPLIGASYWDYPAGSIAHLRKR